MNELQENIINTVKRFNELRKLDRRAEKEISQKELHDYVELDQQIKTLVETLNERKELLTIKLKQGAVIEPGALLAQLETKERRNPAWKQKFIDLAGQRAADIVLAETTATTSETLSVRERETHSIDAQQKGTNREGSSFDLGILTAAKAKRLSVEIDYDSASTGRRVRIVIPTEIHESFMLAFDPEAGITKRFNLDRLKGVKLI